MHDAGYQTTDTLDKRRQEKLQSRSYIGDHAGDQLRETLNKARQHDLQTRQQVVCKGVDAVDDILHQLVQIKILIAHAGQKVAPRRLHGVGAALDGGGRLFGGRAGNTHLRLHHMDSVHDIRVAGEVVFDAGNLLRISQQPLHFLFRAAVAQLQIVQHGVVLFGKALIGILDAGHVRAHLVGVIRHIRDRAVRFLGRSLRVAAQRLQQGCGEAGDGLHVLVRAQAGSLVGVVGILLHLRGGLLEQGVHAADQLLLLGKAHNGLLAEIHKRCGSLLDS